MQSSDQIRRNLNWIATALDSQFRFLGIRVGWDGIIGLIPVFGDVVTTIVSCYIVLSAYQLGAPFRVLTRMGFNIVVDNLISGIPILGWFFDFIYRSNLKNLALIDRHLANPSHVASRSRLMIAGLILVLLTVSSLVIGVMAWLLFQVGTWLMQVIS